MNEAFTLYKLIILYTLDTVSTPMTNSQLCDLMTDLEITTYFRAQEALSEMVETGLICPDKIRNVTQYTLTEEGTNTIRLFENQINTGLREDVRRYLKEHALEIRNSLSHPADYFRNTSQGYTATFRILEKNEEIFSLSLTMPTEEAVQKACHSWDKNFEDIYSSLMEKLL